jgi:transketolase
VLNGIAEKLPCLIGGSADLAPSNKTLISSSLDLQKGAYDGRNIRFGVREHAMGSILSGLALHKGLIPYGGTFLVFADYMRPAIRLASLMKLHVIYVFTHDSIAVGEDGPTHQPVEHLLSLRAIPGLTVIRPADATETAEAWRQAISISDGPVALILSRQNLPVLDREQLTSAEGLAKGGYILSDPDGRPDIIIIATGSEVHICLEAQEMLKNKGIKARVVSMPSIELFEKNPQEYKNKVLPPDVKTRIIVEAGLTMGWDRYAGEKGAIMGMSSFGASAPGGTLMEKFGFTADVVVKKCEEIIFNIERQSCRK